MKTSSHWYRSAQVKLCEWDEGPAVLTGMHSEQKNQGHASELMEQICRVFDTMGMTVLLDAQPYGKRKDGLDQKQLIKFYEKYGFKVADADHGQILMERTPRT